MIYNHTLENFNKESRCSNENHMVAPYMYNCTALEISKYRFGGGGVRECLNSDKKLCWAEKMPSSNTLLKHIRESSIADKAASQKDDKLY